MTRKAKTPRASRLTTTTGRTFRISSATVGSRLTSHTSPRAIVIDEVLRVEGRPLGQFGARLVEVFCGQRSGSQAALLLFLPLRPLVGQVIPHEPRRRLDHRQPLGVTQRLQLLNDFSR